MRRRRSQYRGTEKRKLQILEAALCCFTEMGIDGTTMEEIRLRSKASNGSIYHHFKGKDQLAASLYLQGIVEYQGYMTRSLSSAADAREGIHIMVKSHLRWVVEHPDWARYLFRMRHESFMAQVEEAIAAANKEYEAALSGFIRAHTADGTLRRLTREVYVSLLFGPCIELSRHWLSTEIPGDIDRIIDELGESIWLALRSEGAPKKRSK